MPSSSYTAGMNASWSSGPSPNHTHPAQPSRNSDKGAMSSEITDSKDKGTSTSKTDKSLSKLSTSTRSSSQRSLSASLSKFRRKKNDGELIEVCIPKYDLEWDRLKAWLDVRFESYGCTFTEAFSVVCLPPDEDAPLIHCNLLMLMCSLVTCTLSGYQRI